MMRGRIVKVVVILPLALAALAVGTAAAMPATRHLASSLWNAPDYLPALTANGQIHFEPGAEEYAREVLTLLPAALNKIEIAQGRRFVRPVTIGVYATREKYAAANASGDPGAVGVGAFGRVVLSPTLYELQNERLPGILAHELSHVHLQGYVSAYRWVRLPNWFKEGLAVMASEGGGDEYVSQREAQRAIQRGYHIDIEDAGSFLNLTEIRFERAPPGITPSHRTVMAYRQAHMFVQFLHDSDRQAFDRMVNAIFDNQPFVEAVGAGYRTDIQSLWETFAAAEQK